MVALGAALVASAVLDTVRPPPVPTVGIAVAARALDAGVTLGAGDVTVRRVAVGTAPDDAPSAASAVVGSTLAVPVPAGLSLVPGVLVPTSVAGPPGTVVTTVRLADPAVAALLAPGMRVDVLAASPEAGTEGVLVARRALVLPGPATDPGGQSLLDVDASASPPLLLAVAPGEATVVAGAAAYAVLSVVVVP